MKSTLCFLTNRVLGDSPSELPAGRCLPPSPPPIPTEAGGPRGHSREGLLSGGALAGAARHPLRSWLWQWWALHCLTVAIKATGHREPFS